MVRDLDAGETEAIFLAQETDSGLLLIDERKGRRVAVALGLTVVGTLVVLEAAGSFGWIDFDEHILRLRQTTFRVHSRLIAEAKARLSTAQPTTGPTPLPKSGTN